MFTKNTVVAYHFTGEWLRNGEPIPPMGEWLRFRGQVIPCVSGLHGSEHPFDALQYAPGTMLHRVGLRGEIQSHGERCDKLVARERRIIASIDATGLLLEFARKCALEVLNLWNAPPIMREYLLTGNESIRSPAAAVAAEEEARAEEARAAWAARYRYRNLFLVMAGNAFGL